MDEYLDIVDESGNLTGKKELRTICHEKGLWHRTVHIYFFRYVNNELELLVHLRSKYKSSNPSRWDTRFGGHVESEQTFESAAERELLEETGLKIDLSKLLRGLQSSYDGGNNKEVTQVYYYNFKGSTSELSFDDGEVEDVKWMSINDIEKSMLTDSNIWSGNPKGLRAIEKDLNEKLK